MKTRNQSQFDKKPVDYFDSIDKKKAPNVKQYLRGVRNYYILSQQIHRPYNYYNFWAAMLGAYMISKILHHYVFKSEYEMRKQPNPLVPKEVFQIRRKHYVFWEISRLARGLPKTFTYSTWDNKAGMMYHVDLEGNVTFEKLNLQEERLDLVQNPMLGPFLRRKEELLEDELMLRRANKLAIYYLNKDKKYDLDNYLLWKTITPLDWIRAAWYLASIKSGYADTYRNEQYLPKTNWAYNHERKMLAINFENPDSLQLGNNLLQALNFELKQAMNLYDKKSQKEK